eukprot:4374207-Heterocapsa_arctica.AAC.1
MLPIRKGCFAKGWRCNPGGSGDEERDDEEVHGGRAAADGQPAAISPNSESLRGPGGVLRV